MNLSPAVKITKVVPTTAVGTGGIVGSTLDMSGFDGVLFIVDVGAVTDGTPGVKASSGSNSGGSDKQDLLGAEALAAANQCAVLDLYRPTDRYITAQVVRGGSTGSVINGVIAIQYLASDKPTINDAATVASTVLVVSPAYGTA